jgi:histone H3/H4
MIQTSVWGTSLLQVSAKSQNPTQAKVAAYLQRKGQMINSKVLAVLALRVAADPFKTVKKMVKDLIVKLMEEATEEAEHKGFCDTELQTNEKTRKAKTEAVEILHAEMDELSASVAETASQIADLTDAVSALDRAVAEATTIRQAEKAKNTETITDAQAAQKAVLGAMKVLSEFYENASGATAMMQEKELLGDKTARTAMLQAGQPEIFDDKPYTGMGGDSGGVMGMIEVIQADFVRLETETSAQEDEAQKEYDEFLNDTELDKTSKKKDLEHKSALKQDQEQALTEKKADLDGTQKELNSAMAYYEKLKPTCISTGESYEDKVARRKEEIESLQEALKILNGEDLAGYGFLQQ